MRRDRFNKRDFFRRKEEETVSERPCERPVEAVIVQRVVKHRNDNVELVAAGLIGGGIALAGYGVIKLIKKGYKAVKEKLRKRKENREA